MCLLERNRDLPGLEWHRLAVEGLIMVSSCVVACERRSVVHGVDAVLALAAMLSLSVGY